MCLENRRLHKLEHYIYIHYSSQDKFVPLFFISVIFVKCQTKFKTQPGSGEILVCKSKLVIRI